MAENVGDSSARPDLELEEEFGEDEGTINEQEMAEAEAGCGQAAVAIPVGGGHPAGIPKTGGHPGGHPAGVPGGPGERQRHGGARSVGFRPGGGPEAIAYQERTGIKAPRIIAWEITRSCNLSCVHCRAAAEFGHYHGELSLDEIKAVIDDIVTISNPIIILTGGEPLMRPDIWEIVDYCHEKGAMPVIGTNATLITEEIAAEDGGAQDPAHHRLGRLPDRRGARRVPRAAGLLRPDHRGHQDGQGATAWACRSTRPSPRATRTSSRRSTTSPSRSTSTRSTSSCSCPPAAAPRSSQRSSRPRSTRRCSPGRTTARRRARCTSSRPTRRTTTASSASSPRPRARRSRARSTVWMR